MTIELLNIIYILCIGTNEFSNVYKVLSLHVPIIMQSINK